MADPDPWGFYEDDDEETCPRCDGDGFVDCHCGGDLCVCANGGTADCPLCHGSRTVSKETSARCLASQREFAAIMARMWEKTR